MSKARERGDYLDRGRHAVRLVRCPFCEADLSETKPHDHLVDCEAFRAAWAPTVPAGTTTGETSDPDHAAQERREGGHDEAGERFARVEHDPAPDVPEADVVEIDRTTLAGRWRYECPNGHIDWNPSRRTVWCRGCHRDDLDATHDHLVDKKTGDRVAWRRVELTE